MASRERVLEMMREGVRLEERAVLIHLEGSLRELGGLQLPGEDYNYVRERLDHLRRETIDHNEAFKKANEEIQAGAADDY